MISPKQQTQNYLTNNPQVKKQISNILGNSNKVLTAEELQKIDEKKRKVFEQSQPVEVEEKLYEKKHLEENPKPEESDEEKRLKRNRQTIAALGDGLSSLSNLYFTTQYAPNTPMSSLSSLSEKMKARYDKIDAERNADIDKWKLGLEKAKNLDVATKQARQELDLTLAKMQQAQDNLEFQEKNKDKRAKEDRISRERIAEAKLKAEKNKKSSSGSGSSSSESEKKENATQYRSADKVVEIQKNAEANMPWTQLYSAILETAKNHKQDGFQAVENGIVKNLKFHPLGSEKATDKYIRDVVKKYWGYSKKAVEIMKKVANGEYDEEKNEKQQVIHYQPNSSEPIIYVPKQ